MLTHPATTWLWDEGLEYVVIALASMNAVVSPWIVYIHLREIIEERQNARRGIK
jgi:hypothetical protein